MTSPTRSRVQSRPANAGGDGCRTSSRHDGHIVVVTATSTNDTEDAPHPRHGRPARVPGR